MLEQYVNPWERPTTPAQHDWYDIIGPNAEWLNYQRGQENAYAEKFLQEHGRYPIGGGGGVGSATAAGGMGGGAGAGGAAAGASGTGTGLGAGGLATGMEGAGTVGAATSGGGWLSTLGDVGTVLGSMADARSNANTASNNTAMSLYDRMLSAAIADRMAQSQRAQDVSDAPGNRMRQQLQSNLIQDWKPVSISSNYAVKPTVSGGIGSVGFNDTTKELAGLNSQDAMTRAKMGWDAPDITPKMNMPQAPEMSGGSWLDTLLGYGGAAASMAGLYGKKR